jgi:hypothetical protein
MYIVIFQCHVAVYTIGVKDVKYKIVIEDAHGIFGNGHVIHLEWIRMDHPSGSTYTMHAPCSINAPRNQRKMSVVVDKGAFPDKGGVSDRDRVGIAVDTHGLGIDDGHIDGMIIVDNGIMGHGNVDLVVVDTYIEVGDGRTIFLKNILNTSLVNVSIIYFFGGRVVVGHMLAMTGNMLDFFILGKNHLFQTS